MNRLHERDNAVGVYSVYTPHRIVGTAFRLTHCPSSGFEECHHHEFHYQVGFCHDVVDENEVCGRSPCCSSNHFHPVFDQQRSHILQILQIVDSDSDAFSLKFYLIHSTHSVRVNQAKKHNCNIQFPVPTFQNIRTWYLRICFAQLECSRYPLRESFSSIFRWLDCRRLFSLKSYCKSLFWVVLDLTN